MSAQKQAYEATAMAGRRKYGKKRFAKLAAKGRHDAAEERSEPKGPEEKE